MIETPGMQRLGISAPIQLAAMPGVATPELVRAVVRAGGLGMVPATMLPPAGLEAFVAEVGADGPGAIGVNFLMPFLDPAAVAVAARSARVVEFFYGEPDAVLVDEVHEGGALACWQVGSLAEALAAEHAGCDLVVAQGTEAGGHVRGQTSLLPLLSRVLDAVAIPVIAAGGIATGRDLAAVLACGASGARMGTRFLAASESGAHPDYVEAVLAASAADTVLTEAFSVGWPDAPHRVLRSCVAASEAMTVGDAGELRLGDRVIPVRGRSVMCPSKATTGRIGAMALYAGESVDGVERVEPASEIVSALVTRAEQALRTGGRGGSIR